MNDFTKEELNHLLKIMDHVYLDNYGQELGIKIQSMIDNYCDHIWTDGSGNFVICSKCHVIGGKR